MWFSLGYGFQPWPKHLWRPKALMTSKIDDTDLERKVSAPNDVQAGLRKGRLPLQNK